MGLTCNVIVTVMCSTLPVKLEVWPPLDLLPPLYLVSGSWESRLETIVKEQLQEQLLHF